MAITFRHDAAGLIPPSNQSTRKYGQSLVLQQQQQKYAGQQAGYDRLFTLGRDVQQNAFQQNRDKLQNDFQLGRDKQQFDWKQQEAEAERQRKFLDEARQQSGRFILDAIENDEFDPATARALRQNMVAESEALGNPQLDATQRAEVMAKLRAERSLLLSNRKPKAPPPTPTDNFKSEVVVDDKTGMRIYKNPKGEWVPVPEPKPQQPANFGEYAQREPEKARAAVANAIAAIQQSVDDGLTALPEGKTVEDVAIEQLEHPFQVLQNRYGQTAPAQPGAQAPSAGQPPVSAGDIASSPPFAGITGAIKGAVAGITGQTPTTVPQAPAADVDPEQQKLAQTLRDGMNGKIDGKTYDAAWNEWSDKYGNRAEADKLFAQADALREKHGKWTEEQGRLMMEARGLMLGPVDPFSITAEQPGEPGGQAQNPWADVATPDAAAQRDADLSQRNRNQVAFGFPKFSEWGDDAFRPVEPTSSQPALPNPRLAPPSSGPLARQDATPTGQRDAKGNVIMSDGSVADPRDAYAMQGKGMTDSLARNTNPDGSPVEYKGGPILEGTAGPAPIAQSSIKTTAPEAFSDLRKKFGDDTDSKNEISALEDAIRGNETPEVQNAGLVVMQMLDKYGGKSPAQGSDDFNSLLEAMRALSNAGVDLKGSTSNAKYRDRAEAIKAANEKSRKRNGSRYRVTPEGM